MRKNSPLEIGLGLRTPHFNEIIETKPKISWFEAISENFMGIESGDGGRPIHILENIRRDYPVVLHGVSLSIGSVDPLKMDYLKNLKRLIHKIDPLWVSDHFCWTGVEGENLHDLMPLPFTEEAITHVVDRIHQVQDYLGQQIILENVSSYITFKHSEMKEWEFITEIIKRSGCGLLFDVNNVYVSSVNHDFKPMDYLKGIPKDSVKQIHLAGYSETKEGLIIDTHDHPVSDPVWDLYRKTIEYLGPIPTLIEWDANIPELSRLMLEAKRAKEIMIGGRQNVSTLSL